MRRAVRALARARCRRRGAANDSDGVRCSSLRPAPHAARCRKTHDAAADARKTALALIPRVLHDRALPLCVPFHSGCRVTLTVRASKQDLLEATRSATSSVKPYLGLLTTEIFDVMHHHLSLSAAVRCVRSGRGLASRVPPTAAYGYALDPVSRSPPTRRISKNMLRGSYASTDCFLCYSGSRLGRSDPFKRPACSRSGPVAVRASAALAGVSWPKVKSSKSRPPL